MTAALGSVHADAALLEEARWRAASGEAAPALQAQVAELAERLATVVGAEVDATCDARDWRQHFLAVTILRALALVQVAVIADRDDPAERAEARRLALAWLATDEVDLAVAARIKGRR